MNIFNSWRCKQHLVFQLLSKLVNTWGLIKENKPWWVGDSQQEQFLACSIYHHLATISEFVVGRMLGPCHIRDLEWIDAAGCWGCTSTQTWIFGFSCIFIQTSWIDYQPGATDTIKKRLWELNARWENKHIAFKQILLHFEQKNSVNYFGLLSLCLVNCDGNINVIFCCSSSYSFTDEKSCPSFVLCSV